MISCPVEILPSPEKPETIRFLGVQWGTAFQHPVYLSQRDRRPDIDDWLLVVKIKGHRYWSGIGMAQPYAPGRFVVFRITWLKEPRDKVRRWEATSLIEIPLRKETLTP